jgi:hypothetical protein
MLKYIDGVEILLGYSAGLKDKNVHVERAYK